jgi:hypothetical protein
MVMILRLLNFALLLCLPFAVAAQQKPAFDPLNPPADGDAAKPQDERRATVVPAPVETMVVTPVPEPAKPVSLSPSVAVKPAAAAIPRAPQMVGFDELEAHVGKMVLIKTNLRTQRKGVIKRFNRAVLIIEDRSRGVAMDVEIPRSTVVEAALLE